ncbi:hypothetical protein SAMN05443247_06015 [Bradyrhizobium erythrophlei]|nr:hypothetical protein SAMN05443247_06015 [Bradyrhizobium erythrophlei]
MASSGRLSQAMAAALGLPDSSGLVAIQALRTADMITKAGRGTSAAEMAKEDAAVVLTALASGAVTSQIADTTKFLLGMPHIMSIVAGYSGAIEGMRASLSLFTRAKPTTLRDGLIAVLAQSFEKHKEEENADETDETDEERQRVHLVKFNPMADLDALSFTVGMDSRRAGGFAILKARVSPRRTLTRFYSTWSIKGSLASVAGSQPKEELVFDPLDVFDCGATLLTATRIAGSAFNAAVLCLAEPALKTRRRVKRLAAR